MKRAAVWCVAGLIGLVFSGCARITTHVVEKPRVDQELPGNRGYIQGAAPAAAEHPKTREMLETNVELPTWDELNPWRKPKEEAAPAVAAPPAASMTPAPVSPVEAASAPSSSSWQPEEAPAAPAPAPKAATYTVQKGDTLQKIAEKYYGSSKAWYRIYKANKETLRNPDRLRPGQKLTIPPAGKPPAATTTIRHRTREGYK